MANHSGIIDNGTYFQIVPSTRKVIVPTAYKTIGTVGEHLAEQLTFLCPKTIDGHEIAGCARKYISWKNVNDELGHDELRVLKEDDENLYLTWTVSNGLTVAHGIVSFSVHFEDVNANNRVIYRWSTGVCKECEILDSINTVLNRYNAVYVAGDTLVIADYSVVEEKTLNIDSNGFAPEGTMRIEKNGTYPVGEYAEVDVSVDPPSGTMEITHNGTFDVTGFEKVYVKLPVETPQISVSENGVVKATANATESQVQLNSEFDSEFVPENIKKGVNIFGIEGTYDIIPTGSKKITQNGVYDVSSVSSIEVAVPFETPSISVLGSLITATANGKKKTVSALDYAADLKPENIKKGVDVFGVEGTYDPRPLVRGTIKDEWTKTLFPTMHGSTDYGAKVYYRGYNADPIGDLGIVLNYEHDMIAWVSNATPANMMALKDSFIVIVPTIFKMFEVSGSVRPTEEVEHIYGCKLKLSGNIQMVNEALDGSMFVLQVVDNGYKDFTVTLTE